MRPPLPRPTLPRTTNSSTREEQVAVLLPQQQHYISAAAGRLCTWPLYPFLALVREGRGR